MPPGWGELLGLLGSGAGYVVAVAILLVIIVAFIHGDLVPGYIYRAERKRGDDAEARLDAAKARDEAAAAAAEVAERAALTVIGLQRAGRVGSDEPD